MSSLWFVVPCHGRLELASICLRQLRRTCDALTENGIEATAVVVSDDGNLETARELGFGTVTRDNSFTSRRFNDGFQLACDPAINPRPADFVCPIGSDDFIDWRIINAAILPAANEVVGFQHISFVREDGREMTKTWLNYTGGCGMRIYPRELLERVGFRPADEDRPRGCDTSILTNVREAVPDVKVMHVGTDARQIVDWKTDAAQLNTYGEVRRRHCRHSTVSDDPFGDLAEFFPSEALAEMRQLYDRALVAA